MTSATAFDLLAKIIVSQDIKTLTTLGKNQDWFQTDNESLAFQYINNFYSKYNSLPSHKLCLDYIPGFPLSADEPIEYYIDFLRNRALYTHIISTIVHTGEKIKLGESGLADARAYLIESVNKIQTVSNHDGVLDYNEMGSTMWKDFMDTRFGTNTGIALGWEFLDEMNRGVKPTDFVTILGRPGSGKTLLTLHSALTVKRAGGKVLYVSMEMSPNDIATRISAMDTAINMRHISTGMTDDKDTVKYKEYLLSNLEKSPGTLHLIHGKLGCRVSEIVEYCRVLKPDIVYIDGAYLLREEEDVNSRGNKVNEIATAIKFEIALNLNLPVIGSYQFNRDGEKARKSGKKMGLEHISWGDSIGQLSSICLGLFEEEGDELKNYRTVSILKGRRGETGEFRINWDFDTSNFSQSNIKDESLNEYD